MSSLDEFTELRRQRVAAGLCETCGGAPVPGQRLCEEHAAKARDRNRRYEQRLRATGRKRPQRIVQFVHAELRRRDELALVAWAIREGRVPTLVEAAAVLGTRHTNSTRVQMTRGAAFGIRALRKRENRTTIPFPVPPEFLEVAS